MGAQLRAPLKSVEHHSSIVPVQGLRGGPNRGHILPRGESLPFSQLKIILFWFLLNIHLAERPFLEKLTDMETASVLLESTYLLPTYLLHFIFIFMIDRFEQSSHI